MRSWHSWASRAVPSIAVLIAFLAFWDLGVRLAAVPEYLLPGPNAVAHKMWELYSSGTIYPHIQVTVTEMLAGYVVGSAVAFVLGALVSEFRLLERMILPYVVALQTMPKVALAPLFMVWFGLGLTSKVVLIALLCFFPVFINVLIGVRSANRDLLELYRALSASRFRIFLEVRLPAAANSIFAGLQVGVVLALIGAIVSEFLASKEGLGYLIQSSSFSFDSALMFSSVLTLGIIGLVANAIIRFCHAKIVFWEQPAAATIQPD